MLHAAAGFGDDEGMSRLIPPVLSTADLPLAVLSAARLDGTLWRMYDGYCPVDEPDRPELRADALSPDLQDNDVVVGRSAAWVHGAGSTLVGRLEVRPRARPLDAWKRGIRYRELSLDRSDVTRVSPRTPWVTTVARTIVDIALDAERSPHDIELVMQLCHGDVAAIRAHTNDLAASHRRPGRASGIEFLRAVAASAERRDADVRSSILH